MTRYVLTDVEQAGSALAGRAAELTGWLDRVATEFRPPHQPGSAPLAEALARVDLACLHAVSAAATRLSAAAESLLACAADLRVVDREAALRMCRWSG